MKIFFDYQATTPVDERVTQAMEPFFCECFGNPASRTHTWGLEADAAVEVARKKVAELVGASSEREIFFTSGATEANNWVFSGLPEIWNRRGGHVIVSAIEHASVLEPAERLKRIGFSVTTVPCDSHGHIDLKELESLIQKDTFLVSVMAANNEIGVINPVAEIGALCKRRQILFHVDGVQGVGYLDLGVERDGIDLLSLSGHKLYGPKGVGALYVRRKDPRVELEPLFVGGGQERGQRSGTLNVPGIVGFGEACRLTREHKISERGRLSELRAVLLSTVRSGVSDVKVQGDLKERLPGNLNLRFPGVDAQRLLIELRGFGLSMASACASGKAEPSHVLRALGLSSEDQRSCFRVSLGRPTTREEVDQLASAMIAAVKSIRKR